MRVRSGIIEDVMLDVMFELPKSDAPRKVIVTKECIEDGAEPKIFDLEENKTEIENLNLEKEAV